MGALLHSGNMSTESRKLGYNKPAREFHLDGPEGRTSFKTLEGWALFDGADPVGGHLTMVSELALDGDAAQINIPPECLREDVPEGARYADWWQCCFIRKQNKFRVWPAGAPDRQARLILYDDIRGPAYVSWHDRGGHIYIHGRLWTTVDDAGRTTVNVAGDEPPAELARK